MANLHTEMFILGFMNIHQLISIPRTIWTWVCSRKITVGLASLRFTNTARYHCFKNRQKYNVFFMVKKAGLKMGGRDILSGHKKIIENLTVDVEKISCQKILP